MNKRNGILILLSIILAVVIFEVWFFTPKSPLDVEIVHPTCDPTKTDCSKFTPDGTPFVRPPEPVGLATTTQVQQIILEEKDSIDNKVEEWKTYTDAQYGFYFKYPNYFNDLHTVQPTSHRADIYLEKAAQGGFEVKYKSSVEGLSSQVADIKNISNQLQVNIYDLNSYRISNIPGGVEFSFEAGKQQWWQNNGQARVTSSLPRVEIGKGKLTGYKMLIGDAGEGFEYTLIPLRDQKVMVEIVIYRGMSGVQNLPIEKILSTFGI